MSALSPLLWILIGACLCYCILKVRQLRARVIQGQAERIGRRTVTELHLIKRGKVSDKWSSYLGYYDALFAPLKDEPVSMLEIGVQNGGSLEVWAAYFRNAKRIIGCDINPRCEALRFDDSRITVLVGDANSPEIIRKVEPEAPFDIIIDDGSHLSPDIRNSFLRYFPMVKPGGIYVIEDTHTLYLFNNEPPIDDNANVLSLLRELTNLVNRQFWYNKDSIENRMVPLLNGEPLASFIGEGWIESIEFRNSIITIKKSLAPTHEKLGERVVVGDIAIVDDGPLRIVQR